MFKMGKRKKTHYDWLPEMLADYTKGKPLRFDRYGEYHMRIVDAGTCCLDIWTTGKYYVVETNYNLLEAHVTERAGEKGDIPTWDDKALIYFLDKMFFPLEVI